MHILPLKYMISSMGKSMNATPFEPRLNYYELHNTASIKDKIPIYPNSKDSFETKSGINKMINAATAQARTIAQKTS